MPVVKSDGSVGILLIEDNQADVRLIVEGLRNMKARSSLNVVTDGEEAMAFLHKRGKYADARHPDLIFLDLNLPKKDGREVLAEIKSDDELRRIPVVVLTTSQAEEDIAKTYELGASCYCTKPIDLDHFLKLVETIADFWLTIVKLPPR